MSVRGIATPKSRPQLGVNGHEMRFSGKRRNATWGFVFGESSRVRYCQMMRRMRSQGREPCRLARRMRPPGEREIMSVEPFIMRGGAFDKRYTAQLNRICSVFDDKVVAGVVFAELVEHLVVRCALLQICQSDSREAWLQDSSETLLGGLLLRINFVAYRAALHVDDALKPIGAFGRGGKAVYPSGVYALHDELRVGSRNVVAFIEYDKLIVCDNGLGMRDSQIVFGCERLKRSDVNNGARCEFTTTNATYDGPLAT